MEDIQNNVINEESNSEKALKKVCRKEFSIAGLKLSAFAIAVMGFQVLFNLLINVIQHKSGITLPKYFSYIEVIVTIHILGFALAALLFHFKPKVKFPSKKLGFWNFVIYFLATLGVGVPLAMAGNIINIIIALLSGGDLSAANASLNIATMGVDTLLGKILMIIAVVITAPIVEEHVFRKFLIDSIGKWGAVVSAITSGLLFGLFHGNLSQFFFATFIGFIFAHVYIRTGRIRYSIFMHMLVNGINAVIMLTMTMLDLDRLQELSIEMQSLGSDAEVTNFMNSLSASDMSLFAAFGLYMAVIGVYMMMILAGFVLFIVFFKRIFFFEKPFKSQLPAAKAFFTGMVSVGMIIFLLICIFQFALYYIK